LDPTETSRCGSGLRARLTVKPVDYRAHSVSNPRANLDESRPCSQVAHLSELSWAHSEVICDHLGNHQPLLCLVHSHLLLADLLRLNSSSRQISDDARLILDVFCIIVYGVAMASRNLDLGPFGDILRTNLSDRRHALGLTAQELANRTRGAARPIGRSAVSEVERGARRVDVDDLVTLAIALETSPVDLLTPKASASELRLGQDDLLLFPDQAHRWLRNGGDVRAIARPSNPAEAELIAIRTQLSQLKEQETRRGVLIDVLHLKLEDKDLSHGATEEIHQMLADETRQRQKERRTREKLEARALELRRVFRGGNT
jgi:transcriptional regulator with XRE-family HTH domain